MVPNLVNYLWDLSFEIVFVNIMTLITELKETVPTRFRPVRERKQTH